MLNVLGQHVEAAEKYVTENPSAHLHMYGKMESKHNRKMGHVTLFSDVPDEVEEFGKGIDFLTCLWYNSSSTHSSKKRRLEQSSKSCMLVAITKKVKAKYEELMAQYPETI